MSTNESPTITKFSWTPSLSPTPTSSLLTLCATKANAKLPLFVSTTHREQTIQPSKLYT